MRAFLVPALALVALPFAFVQPSDVQAGYCTREVVAYTVFLPPAVQLRLADAGFPITPTATPYKHLVGRAWTCSYPDGGSDFFPPRVALAASVFRRDLVTVASPGCFADAGSLCPSGDTGDDDGGDNTDPLQDDGAFECACSNGNVLADGGATCRWRAVGGFDGGNAPVGLTLPPGSFVGPGCKPKACGELWLTRSNPDGGADVRVDSFPPACPTP